MRLDLLNSGWLFTCPKLLPNGRCGVYENRPNPCRIYEAGNETNCTMFRGLDKRKVNE